MKKRILAVLLALVLCLGLAVPALAAEVGDTTVTDANGITYQLSNPISAIEHDFVVPSGEHKGVYDAYVVPEGTTIVPQCPEGYTSLENGFQDPQGKAVSFFNFCIMGIGNVGLDGYTVKDPAPESYGGKPGDRYYHGIASLSEQGGSGVLVFLAEGKDQPAPLPFTDVETGRWSYENIKFCTDRGLFKGKTETTFDPEGTLNVAEAVTLAARLYSLTHGGDGTVPALPDFTKPYVRFLDKDGTEFASFAWGDENLPWNQMGPYIGLSRTVDDPDLPETCTMLVGIEGYAPVQSFTGTRKTFRPEDDQTGLGEFHGLYGTGYMFEGSRGGPIFNRWNWKLRPENTDADQYKDLWWYPAEFYLASQTEMTFSDVRRLTGNTSDGYDPAVRFTRDAATRSLFASLIDLAVDEEMKVLNDVSAVPDVDPETNPSTSAILRLYGAGILTGVDSTGRFDGAGTLTREQAAAVLARVLDPQQRKTI